MPHDVHLGRILTGENHRDAVHIAVAPAVAETDLSPGTDVGFMGKGPKVVGYSRTPIGIVDPFLKESVKAGEQFYVFLYPQTITSLRHEWTHPAFDDPTPTGDPVADSKKWIEDFAARIEQTYNSLMRDAARYLEYGEYTRDDSESYKDFWEDFEEFWEHYQVVTGKKVEDKGSFYTCGC